MPAVPSLDGFPDYLSKFRDLVFRSREEYDDVEHWFELRKEIDLFDRAHGVSSLNKSSPETDLDLLTKLRESTLADRKQWTCARIADMNAALDRQHLRQYGDPSPELTVEETMAAHDRICEVYRAKRLSGKSLPVGVARDKLLAVLCWEFTKRVKIGDTSKQKGMIIPYWGLSSFIYLGALASGTPDVREISCELIDTYKLAPSSVAEIYKVAKEIAEETKVSTVEVYGEFFRELKRLDTCPRAGFHGVWSTEKQEQIRTRITAKMRMLHPSKAEEAPPASEKRERKPRPTKANRKPVERRPTFEREQLLAVRLRETMGELLAIRTAEIPEAHRGPVVDEVRSQLDAVVAYLHAKCSRITLQQKTLERDGAEVAARLERVAYEKACNFFGVEAPKDGIADYDTYIKRNYRIMSTNYHPDKHPDNVEAVRARFEEVQAMREVILSYNQAHAQKEAQV